MSISLREHNAVVKERYALYQQLQQRTTERDVLRRALEHVVANVDLAPTLPLTTLDIAGIRAALSRP